MESNKPSSLYPKITDSNSDVSTFSSSSSNLYPSLTDPIPDNATPSAPSLYPSLEMKNLVENLFPEEEEDKKDPKLTPPVQETLVSIPGAILHLIDRQTSLELAAGTFSISRIRQSESTVAVVAKIDDIQWPLARDEAAVKLDDSHYFFTLHDPSDRGMFSYGLTFAASKGQHELLEKLDEVLESCASFSRQKVNNVGGEVLDGRGEVTVEEVMGERKVEMEERSAAYWTTLAPNVEDYGGSVARVIAMGSGRVIQGILWCGDVTVERLKWGEELLKRKMDPNAQDTEVSKEALERMKRFAFAVFF